MTPDTAITVLIQTSPVAAHPSTETYEAVYASIRHWLPNALILTLCDGVRPEQAHYKKAYKAYREKIWKLSLREPHGRVIYIHTHRHQIGCLRIAFAERYIKTPLILYMEHDCPLVTDRPIDWQGIVNALLSDDVWCVRFLPESRVCPYHLYLYEEQFESHGVPLWKTRQWSQRPHLATTELYKRVVGVFTDQANTMIEDRLATFVMNQPWDDWRCATYIPGDNYHRSLHLDGRKDDSKFEDLMVF